MEQPVRSVMNNFSFAFALLMYFEELHQLSSPNMAADFLDDLLAQTKGAESAVADTLEFSRYMIRSWIGIYRSLGLH